MLCYIYEIYLLKKCDQKEKKYAQYVISSTFTCMWNWMMWVGKEKKFVQDAAFHDEYIAWCKDVLMYFDILMYEVWSVYLTSCLIAMFNTANLTRSISLEAILLVLCI